MVVSNNFCKIQLPIGWVVDEADETTSLYKQKNGLGALQLSYFTVQENYKINLFDELFDFIEDYVDNSNNYRDFNNITTLEHGLLIENIINKGRKWIFAILNNGEKIVLISYNSELDNHQQEEEEAKTIIKSIDLI